jgi:phosphonate transport system substrate-binding protein
VATKLQALTFLAPNMLPVYRFMLDTLSQALGYDICLKVGRHYEEVLEADLAFICGLPYIFYAPAHIEALVAPILKNHESAIYFSDVIVRRDSPYQSFNDLRGCAWAYNEPLSQSGYGITRYHLTRLGETQGYFGEVIATGYHQKSIQMVYRGEVDASAIDEQVLAIEMRKNPQLTEQLRVIARLGPSTIQPLTVATRLPAELKQQMQMILVNLHEPPEAQPYLERGFMKRWVAIHDSAYDDIRQMLQACTAANFLTLR